MTQQIPDEIMREAHLLVNRFYLTDYGKDELGLVARALLARDTAARKEQARKDAEIAWQYEGKPCQPSIDWTDEQASYYDAGQMDASSSIAAAIEATMGGAGWLT